WPYGRSGGTKSRGKKMLPLLGSEAGYWGRDDAIRYLAGERDYQSALADASNSILKRGMVHHAVGLECLALGNRNGAREAFEECVNTGAFWLFEYDWSRAYLVRMARDPNWPDWIEKKQ